MDLVLLEGASDLVTQVLVKFFQICSNRVSSIRHNRCKGNFEFGVEALVGEEGGDHSSRMRSIVVCKFGKGQEVDPVILLVVDVYLKVLFQDLVNSFSLPISLWVIGHREIGLDTEQLAKRPPEARDEVLPTIRDDVCGCAMLREDLRQKNVSQVLSIDISKGGDEECHLGHTAHNHQDRIMAIGQWEPLDEVLA